MYDVITIGSALIDVFIHSDQFQLHQENQKVMLCQDLGEKIEVDSLVVHTGGGGSNTAVGFRRMGFATAAIAETGRDAFSQVVFHDLEVEKVDTSLIVSEHKEQTGGSVILVNQDGGRTVLVHRGAASQLDVADIPQDKVLTTSWIHLSSISGRLEVLQLLFSLSKNSGIPISWNPGKSELTLITEGQLNVSDITAKIMILNTTEWATVEAYQTALLQAIPEIVVTDGKDGGTVYINGIQTLKYEAQTADSVDDTGAGDAFSVGFVSARLSDLNPDTAVLWGVRNAASVVEHFGAKPGLLTKEQVSQLFA